jgi:hypothetical protein
MTTKAEVSGSCQIVKTYIDEINISWYWVIAIVLGLVLALMITTFVVALSAESSVGRRQMFVPGYDDVDNIRLSTESDD